jgi:hypothetical protein
MHYLALYFVEPGDPRLGMLVRFDSLWFNLTSVNLNKSPFGKNLCNDTREDQPKSRPAEKSLK